MFLNHFFSFFGIEIVRFRQLKYTFSVLFVLILMLLVSYKQTYNLSIQTDFAVFWHAGNNFKLGNDLYSNIGGADRFIYPPFAAWCFQIFAWLPMNSAGFCWCFFNFGLYSATIYTIYSIFLFYKIDEKKVKTALFISFLLSFRYFWYHQQYVQMNLLMLFLTLKGILAYLKKQENTAIFYLIFAAFIKILPVFFLFWIFCRGNYKTLLKMIGISFIFILIPCIQRGFPQGIQDHINYYYAFLEPFQNGRVEPKLNNYSLSAMIFKWCLPIQNGNNAPFQLLNYSVEQAQFFYKCSFAVLTFIYLMVLYFSRKYFKTPIFHEISFIFCFMHLVSGISWEYHFVSLIFPFVPLLLFILEKKYTTIGKYLAYSIVFVAILVGIDGQDTIGKTLHLYFNHFCAITLLTLFLLFFSLHQFFRETYKNKIE